MTIITIKKGTLSSELNYETPMEAVQGILKEIGYVALSPIKDKKIANRVNKHQKENINRPLNSYENN